MSREVRQGKPDDARHSELGRRLVAVQEHIDRVCAEVQRPASGVTLIVVTKTWPEEDIERLVRLGVSDVGENKAQELSAKFDQFATVAPADVALRWHFIGQLQTNKAAIVAQRADVVHCIDRLRLVPALAKGLSGRTRPLDGLVQVSLDPPGTSASHRGGVPADQLDELAAQVQQQQGMTLRGVMGVAPNDGDARSAFARLQEISAHLRETYPHATWISAGMSGDLDAALEFGATHLRVGSAILGQRPLLG